MSSPSFRPHGPVRRDPADTAQLESHPVSLRRIAALFAPHRRRLLLVVALIAASSVMGLATPFLTRHVIDVALPEQDVHLLLVLVGAMLVVTVVTAALGVLQTWLSTDVGQHVMHRLRTDVFVHLQRQPMSFFTRTRGGEVQSRLTHDIGAMQSVVTGTATAITANVTTAIATIVAMVALSWQLALLSLVVLPPAIWLTRRVAQLRREVTAQRQSALAGLHGQVEESLSVSGALLAKTLGAGPELSRRFADSSEELADLELRSELAGRWRMATTSVIFSAIPALIYLVAGLPGSGDITIGTLVAFIALQSGLFRPLMGVLNTGVQVTASLALFSRIFEYLDLPVEIDDPVAPVALPSGGGPGAVTFEDVSFRYPDADADAVTDLDLHVPAGTRLALVGESGAGKSTIAGLVARLQDPTSGRVLLDGVDLRDLTLTDLACQVGVVSQETYLLHTTVRENLRYARPEATDEEIEAAARAAQVHDVILALPRGYDTVVGARGHRFSGGEKQRLAIARTLLRDPRVLVLDEATSALDTRTEHAVQEALDVLSRGRTTITIAHRLSTVRDADLIAVVDHGELVEVGNHEDLLAADGHYAALVRAAERQPALVP
ncbi:ATP-binding cassette, subfamily B [Georgenia satyanarayanai]|uniref:ATP-binding cassette, subfamily B n=1 Tax=Georgenia satyanarayanai TaxID=860221 RepID=A0A2Y9BYW9_9MICO|nr:ABC transporter ATP-binding protein [Georgenia satyanarayanai]PYF99194.1 ATP-binding cassette subfamily B protein [Georgenia satyanarayanai]SSA43312.1 ATP-binding cassette, subfamily B [Georgenia satyanarayanai]